MPATKTDKMNVYNALKHSENNRKLIIFSTMDVVNKAALDAFFEGCVDPGTYGSVVDLTDKRLRALQSATPPFDVLTMDSKQDLETLFRQWPGLEYMSPAHIPRSSTGSTESSSRGLNSFDDLVRGDLPDANTEINALRLTMAAAKKEAIGCGFSRQDFQVMVPKIFNIEFQGYAGVLAEIMSDYKANNAHNEDDSVSSQQRSVRRAAYDYLDYWAGLFPLSFSGRLRNRLFIEE